MKFALLVLSAVAAALPNELTAEKELAKQHELAKRQADTANDLENGKCGTAVLIFARGSTEAGNEGSIGPQVCSALQSTFGAANIACQGVGGPYTASLADNFQPQGTSQAAINEAERLFNLANTQCPNSKIVSGGYSQGTAVLAGAIPGLSATVRNKVVGTVLFGYTKNQQNGGEIPTYPADRLLVDCAAGDPVCSGTLSVNAAHLSYMSDGSGARGAAFLASKIQG